MFGLTASELSEVNRIIDEQQVQKALVFGSRAKGNYTPGSDVDIAIVGDEKKLSYALNEESHLVYYFDVVNLEKISNKALKEHIKRIGKSISA